MICGGTSGIIITSLSTKTPHGGSAAVRPSGADQVRAPAAVRAERQPVAAQGFPPPQAHRQDGEGVHPAGACLAQTGPCQARSSQGCEEGATVTALGAAPGILDKPTDTANIGV